ncbi:MAG: putative DNA methylase, partial [uncultured bacterium]
MPLAILGNTPELSALELGVPWDGGQIAELPGTVDLQRLGGTVKLADVIGNDISDCLSILKSVPSDHKLVFGFSVYAGDHTVTTNQLAAYAKKLRDLGMHWKKQLKESGRSVRLVVSNEPTLSSVIVTKEHLLKDQTDFVVVLYQAKTVIGRTTAVQDYKEFSRRDYGRPQRDAFSGMLPPKVARMLVNIGTNRAHQSVETCHGMSLLDPFCGSGT